MSGHHDAFNKAALRAVMGQYGVEVGPKTRSKARPTPRKQTTDSSPKTSSPPACEEKNKGGQLANREGNADTAPKAGMPRDVAAGAKDTSGAAVFEAMRQEIYSSSRQEAKTIYEDPSGEGLQLVQSLLMRSQGKCTDEILACIVHGSPLKLTDMVERVAEVLRTEPTVRATAAAVGYDRTCWLLSCCV
eukprot:SAG31_NODE_1273_length_9057_cov_13.364103_9_plen_189_part_00